MVRDGRPDLKLVVVICTFVMRESDLPVVPSSDSPTFEKAFSGHDAVQDPHGLLHVIVLNHDCSGYEPGRLVPAIFTRNCPQGLLKATESR